ncbi:MAG: hypothetical protein C4576_07675 [Desulfobacteraceae bacterium]|nr:MAG: hypothetical protein C4576_07675 [Desulfobacteraceae bacterium]
MFLREPEKQDLRASAKGVCADKIHHFVIDDFVATREFLFLDENEAGHHCTKCSAPCTENCAFLWLLRAGA